MPTVQEIIYDARALINEYNEEGVILSDDDITTIETDAIRFVDQAQKEMYKDRKVFKEYEITRQPYDNLLGLMSNFDIVQFEGDDQTYKAVGAKAYYFEVDDDSAVYIEENISGVWTALTTLNISGITQMTAYKGLITPSDSGNEIRIRFSGTTFYNHMNRCLYKLPFKADKIPDYKPWVAYDMPADFAELDKIITEYPERQYVKDGNYKWEGFNKLYVNYYYKGKIRVIYYANPTTITALTDTIEINNPIAIQAMINYVAGILATSNVPDLANLYIQRYQELKIQAFAGTPVTEQQIEDVYGGYYG